MSAQNLIRNFSIIAHIDHGKSTLADRFIQYCGGLEAREMTEQVLDSNPIERERGITIKAQAVTLPFKSKDGNTYKLNFIDTPGHVDFSYEVSRSLASCEGALLVVDASQGVEAQTVANCYTALNQNLEVLPVINKIDLPAADPARVCQEIEDVIGVDATDAVQCSAKSGIGIVDVLEALVKQIPAPSGDPNGPLQALIVDSWFDNYLGVVSLVRVIHGRLVKGQKIRMMSTHKIWQIDEMGVFTPKRTPQTSIECGEVGYLIAGIKDIDGAPVGDTITDVQVPCAAPLDGFQTVQPRVFAGLYPIDSEDYEDLRESLRKLRLNDSALAFEPEVSSALGFGFRCGFLGMLHLEIVQERLEREYNLNLITTAPSVIYEVELNTGEILNVANPADLPETYKEIREPIILANILTPQEYVGSVMQLCLEKRGIQKKMNYLGRQVQMEYELPMGEVVLDFFDRLKSVSRGYASFDYTLSHFTPAELSKLDVLINGDPVGALAMIVHKDTAYPRGRGLTEKLQELIPRQMFDVAIQAALGSKIIARSTVKALRKDVTAKCYGGDISRKKKLLEKQKEGKKRMKQVGSVEIPQEAFLAVLKVDK